VQESNVIDVLALGRKGPLHAAIVPVTFVALRINGNETILIRKEIEVIPIQVRTRPPCSNAPRSMLPSSFGMGGKE
jgi:hypothetical protein